jgi:hypothetical protein
MVENSAPPWVEASTVTGGRKPAFAPIWLTA